MGCIKGQERAMQRTRQSRAFEQWLNATTRKSISCRTRRAATCNKPDLLLLDEPVSTLDVSVQARILELLEELQREMGIAYVLVSHDLSVVANFAHRVLVLRHGPVIEQGSVEQIFNHAASAYTRELIEAIPGRHEVAVAVAV